MYTLSDNNDDGYYDNYISRVSLPLLIIPTTTPTTTAADLLLSLMNQAPATSPPSSSPSSPPSLSSFNFSYIDVTPQQTTTDPSIDSDTVISSSLPMVIKNNPCDNYDTAILPTSSDKSYYMHCCHRIC